MFTRAHHLFLSKDTFLLNVFQCYMHESSRVLSRATRAGYQLILAQQKAMIITPMNNKVSGCETLLLLRRKFIDHYKY